MAASFNIDLVTGYTGEPHVTADQARMFNYALVGYEDCCMDNAYGWSCEVTGANAVRIGGGDAIINGAHVRSDNSGVITLEANAAGYKRNDLVGIEVHANDGVESAMIKYYKGTPVTGTPSDPSYPAQALYVGGTVRFYPLWRIVFNGASISTTTKLFTTLKSLKNHEERVKTLENKVGAMNNEISFSVTPTGGGRALVNTNGKNIICIHCAQANVVGIPYSKAGNGWWCQFLACASGTAITAVTTPVSGTVYVI